jgi:hypothetical protein
VGQCDTSTHPWEIRRRLALVWHHGTGARNAPLPGWVETVIGDIGWAEERATSDRLTDAVASGSVDGRQVALRELSGRVRAQRDAMQTFEVPA